MNSLSFIFGDELLPGPDGIGGFLQTTVAFPADSKWIISVISLLQNRLDLYYISTSQNMQQYTILILWAEILANIIDFIQIDLLSFYVRLDKFFLMALGTTFPDYHIFVVFTFGQVIKLLSLFTFTIFVAELRFILNSFWPTSASLDHLFTLTLFFFQQWHSVILFFEPIDFGRDLFNRFDFK